jgi:hypothetical protein
VPRIMFMGSFRRKLGFRAATMARTSNCGANSGRNKDTANTRSG